jgi:hypothetical protein
MSMEERHVLILQPSLSDLSDSGIDFENQDFPVFNLNKNTKNCCQKPKVAIIA